MHPSLRREELAAAASWEQGCHDDPVRNEVVVPELVELIERLRPRTIVDLGAGTGYVARKVDAVLGYKPDWTLVDSDQGRLSISQTRATADMRVAYVEDDITLVAAGKLAGVKFDLVLLCFTMLEFTSTRAAFKSAYPLVEDSGLVVLVLPDPVQELVEDFSTFEGVLSGRVTASKIDKFTGLEYPFYVSRNEDIISDAIYCGFELSFIKRLGSEKAFYVMGFNVAELIPS